jgi:hypothetical protein
VRHVCIREMRSAYRVLVRKPEGKSPLGRLVHMYQINIKFYLEERGQECVGWIYLALVRNKLRTFVDTVMNHRIPYNTQNFLTSSNTRSSSIKSLTQRVSQSGSQSVSYLVVLHVDQSRKSAIFVPCNLQQVEITLM